MKWDDITPEDEHCNRPLHAASTPELAADEIIRLLRNLNQNLADALTIMSLSILPEDLATTKKIVSTKVKSRLAKTLKKARRNS